MRGLLAELRALPAWSRGVVSVAVFMVGLLAATGTLDWPGTKRGGAFVLWVSALGAAGAWNVVLSILDVREHRLPNPVLGAAALSVVPPVFAAWAWSGELRHAFFLAGVAVGAALLGVSVWAAFSAGEARHRPPPIGAGDVKLLPIAVIIAGASSVRDAVELFPFALAGCIAVAACASVLRRRAQVPIGPAILTASWLAPLAGSALRAGTLAG